ncbi:MAG: hypothetical protein JJE50_01705 [Actinomycetales bacterium]|nr:hypothetical protein [Actinomycetales bacterium]
MRLGVLDIGSNTVHLLVVDVVRGARPVPAVDKRSVLRLMQYIEDDGSISTDGVALLARAVDSAMRSARAERVDEMLVMVTSALREATNGEEVLADLRSRIGGDVQVLSGPDEARLTFLAARRWHGWAAGRLLVLDIGGGSLEVASGVDEEPDLAMSLPLGAGRLTRTYLSHDPPSPKELKRLRSVVRSELKPLVEAMRRLPPPDHVVATSKTFRSLARLAGMRVNDVGPDERWQMSTSLLSDWLPRLARIPAAQQIVAGAVVAEQVLIKLGVELVEICPWALREGALLRRLDRT